MENTLLIVVAPASNIVTQNLCRTADMPAVLSRGLFKVYTGKCGPDHTYNRRIDTALTKLGLTATETQVHEIEKLEQEVIDFVLAKPTTPVFSVPACDVLTVYVYPAYSYDRSDDHPLLEAIVRSVVAE